MGYTPPSNTCALQWGYLAELVIRALEQEPAATGARRPPPSIAENGDASAAAAPVDLAAATIVDVCRRLGIPSPSGDDWGAILGRAVGLSQEESAPAPPLSVPTATGNRNALSRYS